MRSRNRFPRDPENTVSLDGGRKLSHAFKPLVGSAGTVGSGAKAGASNIDFLVDKAEVLRKASEAGSPGDCTGS